MALLRLAPFHWMISGARWPKKVYNMNTAATTISGGPRARRVASRMSAKPITETTISICVGKPGRSDSSGMSRSMLKS